MRRAGAVATVSLVILAGTVVPRTNAGLPAAFDRAEQRPPPPPPVSGGQTVAGPASGSQTGTGIIRGRVIAADTGVPIRGAQVRLSGGSFTPADAPTVVTDAQGRYEIANLPSGRYGVNVSKVGFVTMAYGQRRAMEPGQPVDVAEAQTVEKIDVALPRGAVIVAHVTDDLGAPMADVYMQVEQYTFSNGARRLVSGNSGSATTNDLGEARLFGIAPGDYYVSANAAFGRSRSVIGSSDSGWLFAQPTYYPGTSSVTEAQRVSVDVGQELTVAFPLVQVRAARITGALRSADGALLMMRASMSLAHQLGSSVSSRLVRLHPDGSFEVTSVMPGQYVLSVGPEAVPGGQRPPIGEYARVPLTVTGDDVSDLVVTTTKGSTLRGRFVFESGVPPPDGRPGSIQLVSTGFISPGRPTWHDDWTFELADIAGAGVLRLRPNTTGWFLKAVLLDGKDVTDADTDFSKARDSDDLKVLLTQKRTQVTGTVVSVADKPVNDYVAVIFAEDDELWTGQSRFISASRPDARGAFRIEGLPPGRYFAAAVDFVQPGAERDPELLQRLQGAAARVALGEGESKTISLRLTP